MNESTVANNTVTVLGKIASPLEPNHEFYGEKFYKFMLNINRLSDSSDTIPVTISERLIPINNLEVGTNLKIIGQFRSYNNQDGENNRLILTVFAREVEILDEGTKHYNPNQIFLDGFLCKPPIYRVTPFGREISDLILAVNRQYNRSDYIPCIAWGRNARYCEKLQVGNRIKLWGRIQSRNYQKKNSDGNVLSKTAYEVSISKMEVVEK
ncbi:MAG: single-stranded DNA-binding protein [Clostridiales bacterium]|nr:single-stranded DNA-binding protein [Clostridiales bacterium]